MTNLRVQIAASPWASFSELDLAAQRFYGLKVAQGQSHPDKATWQMHADMHTLPIAYGHFVRLWEDGATDPDGSPYTNTNPLFEGWIEEITPADNHRVEYSAVDPTSRAGREVHCMSQPWDAGNIPNTPPPEGLGAIPRVVFNSTIDNDDDHQLSRDLGLTLGEIIKTLLDDAYHPLYWINAAPGDGSSAGNGTAYVQSDLDLLTFAPQEKLVFESETVRSAIERMLQYEPRARLKWIPGTRKWRVRDITVAPTQTLHLNNPTATNTVLSLDLDRSLEGRATAIKFYGPESHVAAIASTQDGSLAPYDSDDYVVLENCGSVEIRSYDKYQVTDTTKRKMAPHLPAWITIYMGSHFWLQTRTESVQATWDGENWHAIKGAWFDRRQGIIYLGGHVYIHSSEGQVVQTCTQHFFPPTHFRLVYAYIGTPITVRRPSVGFEGTAFTLANLTNEIKWYDESLAVGYELGTPVTTATRLAQFAILAQALLNERKDVIYTGGCTIDGISYSFDRLYHRANIAGVDEDGNAVVTGWESIGALVTDVEYDFDERLTTLQFSSDQLELIGWDADALKERLKIRALERRAFGRLSITATRRRRFTEFGTAIIGSDINVSFESVRGFENPFTGGIDQAVSFNAIGGFAQGPQSFAQTDAGDRGRFSDFGGSSFSDFMGGSR